nr:unnamed protein product [Ananas comosus var. bracteatus]
MNETAKNVAFVYKRRRVTECSQNDCRKTVLSPDEACKSLDMNRVSFTSSFDLSTMKRTSKNVGFVYKRRKRNECNWSDCGKTIFSTMTETAKNVGFVYKRRKCNEWNRNDCRKASLSLDESCKSLDNVGVSFTSSFNLPRIKRTAKNVGFVYEKQKSDRKSVTYLSRNATESLKQSAKCNSEYYKDGKTILSECEDACETLTNVGVSFSNSSDLSATKSMFPVSSPKMFKLVFKRTKFDRNSLAFISENTTYRIACPCSSASSDEQSVILPIKTSNCDLRKPALNSIIDDRCSSSVSCVPSLMKKEEKGREHCSSKDADVVEQLNKVASVKELCISVLKSDGLLGDAGTSNEDDPIAVPCDRDANCSETCKICGLLGNLLEMLICDICEEAFHLPCCKPKIKKIPVDEWYCQTCFRTKRKSLSAEYSRNKSEPSKKSKSRSPRLRQDWITLMLKDTQPYTTGVPIGEDFQADIPDWSGPMSDSASYYD